MCIRDRYMWQQDSESVHGKRYIILFRIKNLRAAERPPFFRQVMYHLWAQNEPRIVPGLGWTFPGQRMYHFWVYFGTFPVPEVEQKNRYLKWNNDVPKQSQTWYNDCSKKERTGIPCICVPICAQDWPKSGRKLVQRMVHFWKKKAWQAAQNLTVQSKVCAKNFLVNIVYKFCK